MEGKHIGSVSGKICGNFVALREVLSYEADYNLQDSVMSCVKAAHVQGLGAMVENVHESLFLSTQSTSTGKVFLPPPLNQIIIGELVHHLWRVGGSGGSGGWEWKESEGRE